VLLVQIMVPVVTAGHWVASTTLLTRRKAGELEVVALLARTELFAGDENALTL
jgi:hypothetical protein